MITHKFRRTRTETLVSAETSLAEFIDEAREMVAVGDLQPSLFAEMAQLKAQMASAVNQRAHDAALMHRGQ